MPGPLPALKFDSLFIPKDCVGTLLFPDNTAVCAETPPLSELPPAKTEVSTPLSSIYPQAKKAKRPTPPPRLALDKGLQDSISSKELTVRNPALV